MHCDRLWAVNDLIGSACSLTGRIDHDLLLPTQIDHDFVLSVSKKVMDARRGVLEGVGKGIARLCTTYA